MTSDEHMPPRPKPIAAAKTDPGLCRDWNEDSVLAVVSPSGGDALLVVADGMGGLGDDGESLGRFASQLVTDVLCRELGDLLGLRDPEPVAETASRDEAFSEEYVTEQFLLAFQAVNSVLHDHQPPAGMRFTSTVVWAFVQADRAFIANSADCRAYHLRHGVQRLVTTNRPLGPREPSSSYVDLDYGAPLGTGCEIQVNRGCPSEAVVPNPDQMGLVHLNVWAQPLEAGDRLFLCSDGLWDVMDDDEIARHLSLARSPEQAVQRLIDEANAKGGPDNIGVAVCEMMVTPRAAQGPER